VSIYLEVDADVAEVNGTVSIVVEAVETVVDVEVSIMLLAVVSVDGKLPSTKDYIPLYTLLLILYVL